MVEISLAVIKLTIITVLGYYFYKKSIIDQKVLDFLIFFVVNFTVPFLGFSHIVGNLQRDIQPQPFVFILLSFAIFGVSFILGYIFSFKRNHERKKEFTSIVSFQNCGYLPLSMAAFLFPENMREKFIIYTFLYVVGFDIIFWSVGTYLIFKKKGEQLKLKSIFTPPIIATILALIFVYSGAVKFIPQVLLSPIRMMGDTSFVLSMIILGCWLARIDTVSLRKNLSIVLEASALKLMLIPFVFLVLAIKFDISSLFGLFIIMQAAMPSAVSLPIVVNLHKADSEFVSQGVLLTHIFSIFTIPLWVGLYLQLSHFSF
ncbi:MAG: AEC family transporter [Candidatus Omnitrophica bacterium]|nr:AEC family transporter [Candidatus Omnitrophota bacterium]